jgi:hypothetical protein
MASCDPFVNAVNDNLSPKHRIHFIKLPLIKINFPGKSPPQVSGPFSDKLPVLIIFRFPLL